MIIGAISDTEGTSNEAIAHLVETEFKPRGVEVIFHLGDIEKQQIDVNLYGGLPVVCVLVQSQMFDPDFTFSPPGWHFTRPSFNTNLFSTGIFHDKPTRHLLERQNICSRLVNIRGTCIYAGHQRSGDVLNDSARTHQFFDEINQVVEGVRVVLSGHTHHQFAFRHGPIVWVNPGEMACLMRKEYEFAIIDTGRNEVVLSRIPLTPSNAAPQTVGLVADTGNIDALDKYFWERLAQEFHERDARTVIICGHFLPIDIGRSELADFEVYYYLQPDQFDRPKPGNWHKISPDEPLIELGGHYFYVQHDINIELADLSEAERSIFIQRHILAKYGHVDFIVCGLIPETLLQEWDQGWTFINPGDARNHRNFATICTPRKELTLGTVRI